MLDVTRRNFLGLISTALVIQFGSAQAQEADIWSADQAFEALSNGEIVMIDIRSRGEWKETGVADGAWPISMHEPDFPQRLFRAQELANGRPVALICATGGRSGAVMRALDRAGYTGFIDVSEGMEGSKLGRGWIAKRLSIVQANNALYLLPEILK